MSKEKTQDQVIQWLKKLERESWQLELLVSAFTIFLLIAATESFGDFLTDLNFQYSFSDNLVSLTVFFMALLYTSMQVLTAFLVIHLLLRGFWIGAIGLRSVQPSIDYNKLNYSEFFLERLKKKVMGLDRLVVILDEMCSVLFSLSFLIIFMIISFGLYNVFLGATIISVAGLFSLVGVEPDSEIPFLLLISITLIILVTGILYLIDYFTLGFFKKSKRVSKIYYPIYRLYSVITLSIISRSIYYNLISKYSKKRIRLLYLAITFIVLPVWFVNFDQYQYFPKGDTTFLLETNFYDDLRPENEHVQSVSLESKYAQGDFMSLFIRYLPEDNRHIKTNCPDFEPLKNDGINPRLKIEVNDTGLRINSENFEEEDKEMLLSCLSEFYAVSVNDSIYTDQKFYFYEHSQKEQKGMLTVLSTKGFKHGENIVKVTKSYVSDTDSTLVQDDFAVVPFWYSEN